MFAEEPAAEPAPASSGRLRNDVVVTYGGKVGALILGLVTSVLLARQLGPSGRGTLAVAFNFTQILVQLGTLGMVTANPYFAATGRAPVGKLVASSLWFAAGLGALLVLGGLIFNLVFPKALTGLDWAGLAVALSMIPATLAVLFLQSLLVGEGRMAAYSGVEVGQAILTLAGLLVGFFVFGFSATGALGVMAVSLYAAVIALLLLLRSHRPFAGGPDMSLVRSLLGYGVKIYVASLAAFLVIRVDVLLVNGYLGSSDAGIYAVTVSLVDGMYVLPAAIGLNLFARVAKGGAVAMSAEVFRSIGVLFAGLCLLSVPLAAPAIGLLYGQAYAEAAELYYWMIPGIFSLGMLTILSSHFAGRGFPIEAMLVWFAGLGVNIAINLLLLDSQGLYIAALSSSVAYTILLLLHMRLFSREVGGWRELGPRPSEVRSFLRTAFTRESAI